jgi:hypothetical protein
MFSKLKGILFTAYDRKVQDEIAKRVREVLIEREKNTNSYIEKQVKDKHKIKEAFFFDGKQFYQFEDSFNMAVGRGMVASEFYNEFSMRCSREFLQAHCTALTNAINNTKAIELTKVAKLTNQLQERLDLIFDVELLYKLASVIYFDENESPYEYDFKYNLEKIAKWKELKLSDFFLLVPMSDIIPLTNLSEEDLNLYTQVSKKINHQHLKDISTMLSGKDKSKDFYKTIALQYNTDIPTNS